jgi:hypothetical protein
MPPCRNFLLLRCISSPSVLTTRVRGRIHSYSYSSLPPLPPTHPSEVQSFHMLLHSCSNRRVFAIPVPSLGHYSPTPSHFVPAFPYLSMEEARMPACLPHEMHSSTTLRHSLRTQQWEFLAADHAPNHFVPTLPTSEQMPPSCSST